MLSISGSSLAVTGLILVSSNIVHVDVQYTVNLSASVSNSVVRLTAGVRYNGGPAGAGINVDFYYSFNGGDWTHFATETTNRGGIARATYTITANGAYDFNAMVSFV